MLRRFAIIFIWAVSGLIFHPLQAQDTLPDFSLTRLDLNRVLVQWKNPDTSLRQLSIQESADSLTGFKTVLTVLNPSLPKNESILTRPMAGKKFYRIYILYPNGRYVFTPAKSPAPEKPIKTSPNPRPNPTTINQTPPPKKRYGSATLHPSARPV